MGQITAQDAVELLLGKATAPRPTAPGDIAGWRAYLTSIQSELMRARGGDTRPSDCIQAARARVVGEFLSAFPGQEAQAAIIFTPSDPAEAA